MGGFGVLAWIAIGAAAGMGLSSLMRGPDDDALRGTAAGMVGAVLAGLATRLLEPPHGAFTTSTAALAGSLWLAWIVSVVTSGRRPGGSGALPELDLARRDVRSVTHGDTSVLTYAAARNRLVDHLLRDAMAHDAQRYHEIGRRFDSLEHGLPRGSTPELGRLRVALTFWDGWIDARDHGWRSDGGLSKADWPLLARTVAADLEGDRDVTDARIVTRFDAAVPPRPGNRVQVLAVRLGAS